MNCQLPSRRNISFRIFYYLSFLSKTLAFVSKKKEDNLGEEEKKREKGEEKKKRIGKRKT